MFIRPSAEAGRSAAGEAVVLAPTGGDAGDTQPAGGETAVPAPAEDPSQAGQRRLPECLRTASLTSFRRAEVEDALEEDRGSDSTPQGAGLEGTKAPDVGAPLAGSGPPVVVTPDPPALSPGCDRAPKRFWSLKGGVQVAWPVVLPLPETTSAQSSECFRVKVDDGRGEVAGSHGTVSWRAAFSEAKWSDCW